MPKKQLALLLTFSIAMILLALLVYVYSQPETTEGTQTPGEKLKEFYTETVDTGGSFFE